MNATIELPASVLTKSQTKKFGPKPYPSYGKGCVIRATVRYDDQCGNGHNSFSITGEIYIPGRSDCEACGMLHEDIAKAFPELAPLLKWHLCSSDGPMHYVENTVYHATQHAAKSGWVYFEDKANGIERHCVKYCDMAKANKIAQTVGYTVEIDPKTAKEANLDHARSSAVWPEATQAQLLDREALLARLPALMADFKAAVESLGFTY